jgi:hypothetical protein
MGDFAALKLGLRRLAACRRWATGKTALFSIALIVSILFRSSELHQPIDDRDYLIRTIAFEASGETELGRIAVAYVVLNRTRSGRWGDDIKAVVTRPGQFEPWMTKRKEIEELSPNDPRYKRAAIVADAVLNGQTPDPTAGATHFLNPIVVRERRGGSLPAWASGRGRPIGRHTFYYPDKRDDSPEQAALSLGSIAAPPFALAPRSGR